MTEADRLTEHLEVQALADRFDEMTSSLRDFLAEITAGVTTPSNRVEFKRIYYPELARWKSLVADWSGGRTPIDPPAADDMLSRMTDAAVEMFGVRGRNMAREDFFGVLSDAINAEDDLI